MTLQMTFETLRINLTKHSFIIVSLLYCIKLQLILLKSKCVCVCECVCVCVCVCLCLCVEGGGGGGRGRVGSGARKAVKLIEAVYLRK